MAHGAPSSSDKWPYLVFLSFRGEDANSSFTSHLHQSLIRTGIRVFHNDEVIRRGEEITSTTVKAIHESRIAIIVFSENYANSEFCLQELVQILECFKEEDQLIYPVFYDVDPLEVQHQTGSYAKALARLEERFINKRDQVKEWRQALSQAAGLSGYHFLPKTMNVHESLRAIVEQVTTWINKKEKGKEEEHDDTVMPHGTLSSSMTYKGPYDVFLSYCVEDLFYFTDLLHLSLLQEGLRVFVRKGLRDDGITSTLFKAIHESRIAIIVFSKNYANSESCLQELEQILESFKEEGRLIFPVYCNVDRLEACARLAGRFKDKIDQVEKLRLAQSEDYHSLTKTTDIREGVRAIVERVPAWMNVKEKVEEEEHDDNKMEEG